MIKAGRLRCRATIEELRDVQDGYGLPSQQWRAVATVWAGIFPLSDRGTVSGREYFASQQHQSEIKAKILIRYISGVTAKMRVRHGGKLYNIEAVINPEERNRELTLLCSEGVNNG